MLASQQKSDEKRQKAENKLMDLLMSGAGRML
jgi:hypothetical protein